MVPQKLEHPEFSSIEDINNYLLSHKDVIDTIQRRGGKPVVTFLIFDEKTEEICKEIGIDIWFPKAKLRARCDNKMETVRIGNKAKVASVPNTLGPAKTWGELVASAQKAGIGTDLVVQTAFGDSGHTTFFISNEDEYNRHAKEIQAEDEVKIMKRINCRGATMEAVATRSGTLVGPLLTEVVGKRELTPYEGGWCGNEIFPGAFSERIRTKARDMAYRFGSQLVKEGYRGYFDLDFLIDEKDGEVYLGELNPRICGASSITNHSAFAYADAPLFLFHLMEFSGLKYKIDVEELNERWAQKNFIDSWSQVVIKTADKNVDIVTNAPPTGIYRMSDDGNVSYDRFDFDRQSIESEKEAFFLRIAGPGDYCYEGTDLGILITRGQVMGADFELNDRARNWIWGIKKLYAGKSLVEAEKDQSPQDGSFKIL